MAIKNIFDSFSLLNDPDILFLKKDGQISLLGSIASTVIYRARSNANIYVANGVLITNPQSILTSGGMLRIALNDFSATSRLDITSIILRPTSRLKINGRVSIGRGCRIALAEHATLSIGDGSYITGLTKVICTTGIEIGQRCAISWGVQLLDSDFHEINGKPQSNNGIKIGNDVLIGSNVSILKNVAIGDGCIIAANSVVRQSMPPRTMAVGNPANIIRQNVAWK